MKILRLPVRHCVLNPIELAWPGLKNYIRDNNKNFRLFDVHNLTMEYLAAVDEPLSIIYFQHIKGYKDTLKAADNMFKKQLIQRLMRPMMKPSIMIAVMMNRFLIPMI